jgi:hypothetical protein
LGSRTILGGTRIMDINKDNAVYFAEVHHSFAKISPQKKTRTSTFLRIRFECSAQHTTQRRRRQRERGDNKAFCDLIKRESREETGGIFLYPSIENISPRRSESVVVATVGRVFSSSSSNAAPTTTTSTTISSSSSGQAAAAGRTTASSSPQTSAPKSLLRPLPFSVS